MSIIFLNGEFAAESEACLSIADRGFTLGDGVFDTLLAMDGALHLAEQHFARLRRHAAIMQIPLRLSDDTLGQAATELLQRNGLREGRYAIRTTLTRGPGARGLALPDVQSPTLLMRTAPAPPPSDQPVRFIIAETVRRNEHSPLSRIKSLNYGDNILALMEAKARGADDAILLNTAGNIACATASNVFIREGGGLITPPCTDGALDGIARLGLLEREGAAEETITPERLRGADEILLTNSIQGVRIAIKSQN